MIDNKEELIKYFYSEKQAGKSYQEIRNELEQKELTPIVISEIIREVDEMVLTQLKLSEYNPFATVKIIGYVLLFGGGALTLGTYTSIIDLNGWYIVAYGPIIGGYSMILASRNKRNKQAGKSRKSYFTKK